MKSTEMLVQNLGRLRQDGQDVQTSLDEMGDGIAAIRDDLDVAKDLASKARGLSTTANSLETIARFLSTAPIVGFAVRALTPAFDRIERSADAIADYADRLDAKIQPLRTNLQSLDDRVEDAELKVTAAVANLLVYENSAQSLDEAFPTNTPKRVRSLVDETNAFLEPTADSIDALTDTLSSTRDQIQVPLDQLEKAIAPFDDALTIALDIENKLGPLKDPLQSLNDGLKPFEAIFNGLDFVVNRTLGPIINPILERTGLQGLIDTFTDALDPLDNLTNPIDTAINSLTADFDSLDIGIETFNTSLGDLSGQLVDIELGGLLPLDAIADGNEFGNLFSGSDLANVFQGFGQKDFLIGGGGDDSLDGGDANDVLVGGTGNDIVVGGKGNDKLFGGEGDDQLDGRGGKDKLDGGDDNDILLGGGGKDRLLGGSGEDELTGGGGKDDLKGGEGNDILDGGGGKDTLDGGEGDDLLTGGGGRDIFVIATKMGTDTITDFKSGQDQIRLIKGLSFNQLSLNQQNGNILIQKGNQTLGIVEGVPGLAESDFVG